MISQSIERNGIGALDRRLLSLRLKFRHGKSHRTSLIPAWRSRGLSIASRVDATKVVWRAQHCAASGAAREDSSAFTAPVA